MTDIPEEMVERITPTSNNPYLDVATRAIVQTALGSLTPEDLDTLARQHGLVLARDGSDAPPDRSCAWGWNGCRNYMLNWREAENGHGRSD